MIKATDLRIGNLVFSTALNLACPVQSVNQGSVEIKVHTRNVKCDFVTAELWNIDPIPLNSELLIRCGFEDDKDGRWTGPEFETDNTSQWFEIEEDHRKKGDYWLRGSEWCMGRPFQYLHQLQNLYHALVGEELTIKETV